MELECIVKTCAETVCKQGERDFAFLTTGEAVGSEEIRRKQRQDKTLRGAILTHREVTMSNNSRVREGKDGLM